MRCPSNQKQSTACPGESPRCLGRRNATDGMAAATDWRKKACGARAFKAAERAGSAAGVRRAGLDGCECRARQDCYIKRSCSRLPGGRWGVILLIKHRPQPALQNHHDCHQHKKVSLRSDPQAKPRGAACRSWGIPYSVFHCVGLRACAFLGGPARFVGAGRFLVQTWHRPFYRQPLADGWNRLPVHSGGDFHFKFNHLRPVASESHYRCQSR